MEKKQQNVKHTQKMPHAAATTTVGIKLLLLNMYLIIITLILKIKTKEGQQDGYI